MLDRVPVVCNRYTCTDAKTMNATNPKRNKPAYCKSVRLNISLPPALDSRKNEVLVKFGFTDFSGYIQARLRKDLGLEFTT